MLQNREICIVGVPSISPDSRWAENEHRRVGFSRDNLAAEILKEVGTISFTDAGTDLNERNWQPPNSDHDFLAKRMESLP